MSGTNFSSASCNWRRWAVVGVLAALLTGCGPAGPAAAPTALPTRTPVPTYTPTPEQAIVPLTATPTDAPPAQPDAVANTPQDPNTPTPQATAVPAAQLTINSDLVNVRSGPGTEFGLVGTATTGATYEVVARNTAGDWWQVCCFAGQNGWIFGELATVANADGVPVAADQPAAEAVAAAPTVAPAATTPQDPNTPTPQAPAPAAPYDPTSSSAGNFDPSAQYQIVHFKVLGLEENNGGIRDSGAQHHIFLTVLDQNGAGIDGAVVRNLVGDRSEAVTGSKGPGRAEIAMYYEPVKLAVVSDPSGPVTSQVSNQMGVIFPHLPDIVGKLGDINYEYGACPTIDIKCKWPLSDVNFLHFSYEITFQRVK